MSVHFRTINNTFVRRLFLFGKATYKMSQRECWVTLYIAKDQPRGSQNFEHLINIDSTKPDEIVEIGYAIKKERFVVRPKTGAPKFTNIESFAQKLIESMVFQNAE